MKEKKPLISVIVPVYKTEQYLDKCLTSIVNQTYENIEIILVDDGSPDSCPQICDDWKKKDNRIIVIHKVNGGLSSARNVGILKSKGEYVCFVDSDDYIAMDFVEYLFDMVEKNKTCISVAPYVVVTEKKKISSDMGYNDAILSNKEVIERMILDKGITVSACSKLFKKELFDGIEFPIGVLFEDTITTYKLMLKCDRISYGSYGGYFYYKRKGSIVNSRYSKEQLAFIKNTDDMGEKLVQIFPELNCSIESKKIDARFSILRRIVLEEHLDCEDIAIKYSIINYIKERKKFILSGPFNKKIKSATLLLLMGEPVFRQVWKVYSTVKYEL